MMDPQQMFFMKHSGCGSLINLLELSGRLRLQKSIKFNKETREISLSNGFSKATYTTSGNKLTHVQRGKKEITIVREFFLTNMIVTYSCEMIKCKKYFKAVNRGTVQFGFS